jgi:LmbE family N-acetylglucosaminyl deacetylase
MAPRNLVIRAGSALIVALALAVSASAQVTPLPVDDGPIGLGLALRRLPTAARVLYVTAHPDDENNPLLVLASRGLGLRTALLTVTRGDGGQNEIGPELFQAIGILRTEELMNLHRMDGVEQYFTRAYEFGYSFSVEETFDKWGKEEILRDVVRRVRLFRPDVIFTMPREAEGGGQHHQASARLAQEAFRVAADPSRFPEQIQAGLRPWQASKVYMQAGFGFGPQREAPAGAVVVRTGDYDPLLGMSWLEYGLLSRRAHRCQGASQLTPRPADGLSYYALVDAEPAVEGAETDVLQGIDLTLTGLARFVKGQESRAPHLAEALSDIEASARQAAQAYDVQAPEKTLPAIALGLGQVRALREQLRAGSLSPDVKAELVERLDGKEADFEKALALAQDLTFHATVDDGDVVPGQTLNLTARVWNRSAAPVAIEDIEVRVPEGWSARRTSGEPATIPQGGRVEMKYAVSVGSEARYSQPYWKRNPAVDRYDIEIPADAGLPWSPPDVTARVRFRSAGTEASLTQPAYWRYEGPWVGGEKQKVLNVVPALNVTVTPEIAIIPVGSSQPRREFRVTLVNDTKGAGTVDLRLDVPSGWSVEPAAASVELRYEGEQVTSRFFVAPPPGLPPGEALVKAVATLGGRQFREGYQTIAYDHIQERHLFRPAEARVKVIDASVAPGISIGYVMGAGDEVPPAIEQLGAPLRFLGADDIAYGDLSQLTTIVTGIRAYQTRPDLKAYHFRLMKFVEDGGHLVVQYNKFEFNSLNESALGEGGFNFGRPPGQESPFAPYPGAVTSNRVSVEEAPVEILAPEDPVLTTPNPIGERDFEGWVQERGLYFFGAKDPRYKELLASSDPWPKNPGRKVGLLTVASVGKGTWTYVGLGLWRQLPAGTDGAYRILANLLSRPRGR